MRKYILLIMSLLLFTPLWAQNVGNPAPDFTFNSLENGELSLSQFQGKVVYIFFFGYN